ncbi:hypothetical protein [Gordonia sp. HS-NH1]|uniref:hypothetical protein n=1 Tax=Gordonia sp. HS-NH1 TaxID=1435068 RepID=UPI000B3332B2|nr:hypothetical protein [Gordonia sp. HS-NH1]
MNSPRPIAPDGLWLDDIAEGATFVTDTHTVDTAEILEFARRYDPPIFDADPDGASGTFFDGLAASGWHVAAITMSSIVTSGLPVATPPAWVRIPPFRSPSDAPYSRVAI